MVEAHETDRKEPDASQSDHPEHQRPLGEPYPLAPEERRTMRILAVALIVGLIAVPILAVTSFSPLGNVFIGVLPFLITTILLLVLVSLHYKRVTFWVVLFFVHLVALGALHLVNALLPTPLNAPQVVVISFLISALVVLLAWMSDAKGIVYGLAPASPRDFTPEALPDFVRSIEDKAKALNFAIGRTYRSSNGGTAQMRERLRIPREWYNEFTEANEEERETRAKVLVRKIYDRLLLLSHRESEVFSEHELKRLKNIMRSRTGESTVLEVLIANDSDPVDHYYAEATDVCQRVLTGLEN